MRVNMEFVFEKEADGFDGILSSSRDDVEDLYTMAQFITDAVKVAGFSYVVDVGFEKSDGEMVFGGI